MLRSSQQKSKRSPRNGDPLMDVEIVARKLLAWFDENGRKLPWRDSRDAYGIWVSEVMLQQTQVATVIPYFNRFLAKFPTIAALAAANEQEVLKAWEGLGYYRRARSLHRAAGLLVAEHAGMIPDDESALRALPGLGRYTTNAILSQAFDRRLPILEANSRRVLCRLLGERNDSRQPAIEAKLWQAAEALLPARRVGDFNQALMELGALVCTPSGPGCATCPLARVCQANALGLQAEIPFLPMLDKIEKVEEVALVIRRRDQLLLVQRPSEGRWANMWEFPHLASLHNESREQTLARLLEGLGFRAKINGEHTTIKYGVTRFRITMTCFDADHAGGRFRAGMYTAAKWLKPGKLGDYPISSPQRKLATFVAENSASSPN